jgi:DNA-binding transcriptional regulator YdaS (Cro superfamily)
VLTVSKTLVLAQIRQLSYKPFPMKDAPLSRAIAAVGGQSELARRIGKTQGHISSWLRREGKVPAECALAVEGACEGAVTRYDLRPDIFGPPPSKRAAA